MACTSVIKYLPESYVLWCIQVVSSKEASTRALHELSAKLQQEYEEKLQEEQRKHREEIENLQVCIFYSLIMSQWPYTIPVDCQLKPQSVSSKKLRMQVMLKCWCTVCVLSVLSKHSLQFMFFCSLRHNLMSTSDDSRKQRKASRLQRPRLRRGTRGSAKWSGFLTVWGK